MDYCKFCGTKLSKNSVFCPKCGKKVKRTKKEVKPHKVVKPKSHKVMKGLTIGIIIAFVIFILVIIFFGRIGVTTEEATKLYLQRQQSYTEKEIRLMSDYDLYTGIINEDTQKYNALINEWNNVQTVDEAVQVANEYAGFYEYAKVHLDTFHSFIINNEDSLRTLGYDTFEMKQHIQDLKVSYKNTIKNMKEALEKEKQKSQALMNILATLLGFI